MVQVGRCKGGALALCLSFHLSKEEVTAFGLMRMLQVAKSCHVNSSMQTTAGGNENCGVLFPCFACVLLGTEYRVLGMLGKHSPTELQLWAPLYFLC